MATSIRRLTRITAYLLLLLASALVSFFSGGKRDIAEHSTQTGAGLIPSTPIAHADIPGCNDTSDSNPPGDTAGCASSCAAADTAGGGGCGGSSGGCSGADD